MNKFSQKSVENQNLHLTINCIDTSDFWYQDTTSCSEVGDVNHDGIINILDIIQLVNLILS